MTSPLARPKWRIGQVLLPDHFLGLESSLSAEVVLRSSYLGLPLRGLARLDWNGESPENGILWVSALTAVLGDDLLLDVPGNARVVAPLDLKLPGKREVDVYAHVVMEDGAEGEPPLEPVPGHEIAREYHLLKLSTEPSLAGDGGRRIALGHFALDDRGRFRLSEEFAPPLLALESTPYFRGRIEQLRVRLAEFDSVLDDRALAALGRGESSAAVLRVRIEARKLTALLADMTRGLAPHPYLVFASLRDFALELSALDERAPLWQPPSYDHDDLVACLGVVLTRLMETLRAPLPESPCSPFALDNGRWVARLTPEALAAGELYVAVLKQRATDRNLLEGVRLASPDRLRLVREHALRGVRLAPVARPPFRHAFGSAVDFYGVSASGPALGEENYEWGHVVRERALAFYDEPRFEGLRIVLCWRPT